MSLFGLPPLRPNFEAAVRDVQAKTPLMRMQAAERLGDVSAEQYETATRALETLLRDPSPPVRCAALESISRLAAKSLDLDVVERVDDDDPTVRELAVACLSRLGTPLSSKVVRNALDSEHPETRFQAVQSYVELFPDDASALQPRIRDEDPRVRVNTALALGQSRDPEAQSLLRECLNDHNPQVRQRAALELAQHGDATPRADLIAALDDPAHVIEAMDALASLDLRDATEAIARRASSVFAPALLKAAAGAALHRLGDVRGLELLRQALTAWRGDGRNFAIEASGSLGVVELIPELSRLAGRKASADQVTLARALERLVQRSPAARPALAKLAQHSGEAGEIARTALETSGNQD